jgi:hypothetical protein
MQAVWHQPFPSVDAFRSPDVDFMPVTDHRAALNVQGMWPEPV